MAHTGLVSFLYILLRDKLPAGVVEALVIDHVEKTDGKVVKFSNPHLQAYAEELAGRIEAVRNGERQL